MPGRLLTVTVPATVFDLTDLETVKDELELDGSEDDDRLQRYITEASGAIASRCGRVFASETVAETFRNDACVEALDLARMQVTAIASIVENGTALSATDYEVDKAAGLVYRLSGDCRSLWSTAKIIVTYTAGYALPDAAPAPLSAWCLAIVKAKQFGRTRDPQLRSEEVPGVISQEYASASSGADMDVPGDCERFCSVAV